jgi:hypothetical protein
MEMQWNEKEIRKFRVEKSLEREVELDGRRDFFIHT